MRRAKTLIFLSLFTVFVTSPALADGYVPESGAESAAKAGNAVAHAKQLDAAAAQERTPRLEQVEGEELSAAIGHYSRTRALLLSALREFDSGYKKARPDAIIDSKAWRDDLVNRIEDLERILAPQARASKYGVRYEGDPRLLSTEAK